MNTWEFGLEKIYLKGPGNKLMLASELIPHDSNLKMYNTIIRPTPPLLTKNLERKSVKWLNDWKKKLDTVLQKLRVKG